MFVILEFSARPRGDMFITSDKVAWELIYNKWVINEFKTRVKRTFVFKLLRIIETGFDFGYLYILTFCCLFEENKSFYVG